MYLRDIGGRETTESIPMKFNKAASSVILIPDDDDELDKRERHGIIGKIESLLEELW